VEDGPVVGQPLHHRSLIARGLQRIQNRDKLIPCGGNLDVIVRKYLFVIPEHLPVLGPGHPVDLALKGKPVHAGLGDLAGPLCVRLKHLIERRHIARGDHLLGKSP
jgi:hypothetical protein